MNCEQVPKNQDNLQNTDTYYRMEKNQDDYISQFISLSLPQSENKVDQIFYDIQEESEKEEKSTGRYKRSQFHNFQKHLITTIRRSVIPEFSKSEESWVLAAREMWRLFKETKKYTKEFLSAVTNTQIEKRVLEKYRLSEIYQKYGETEYKLAQQFLKNQIIATFHRNGFDDLLYDRRLEKKSQFEDYLRKTIGELQNGEIHKRFTKSRKPQCP